MGFSSAFKGLMRNPTFESSSPGNTRCSRVLIIQPTLSDPARDLLHSKRWHSVTFTTVKRRELTSIEHLTRRFPLICLLVSSCRNLCQQWHLFSGHVKVPNLSFVANSLSHRPIFRSIGSARFRNTKPSCLFSFLYLLVSWLLGYHIAMWSKPFASSVPAVTCQNLQSYFFLSIYTWVRASWIEFNNCQTRCDLLSLLYICRQLYMFRVLKPIIRSSYNCNYSFWYWLTGSTTIRSRCWVGTDSGASYGRYTYRTIHMNLNKSHLVRQLLNSILGTHTH